MKWHEVTQTFAVVDRVREMTSETCKYDEYGSFEDVPFLFISRERGKTAYLLKCMGLVREWG